jgi:hypothetical protein
VVVADAPGVVQIVKFGQPRERVHKTGAGRVGAGADEPGRVAEQLAVADLSVLPGAGEDVEDFLFRACEALGEDLPEVRLEVPLAGDLGEGAGLAYLVELLAPPCLAVELDLDQPDRSPGSQADSTAHHDDLRRDLCRSIVDGHQPSRLGPPMFNRTSHIAGLT